MILRVYQKSLPYEVRFLRCGLRQTYFFVILGHFLPFHPVFCPYAPLWTQKIKILKLWKKTPGAITILQRCTMNDNHMMYGSWDMERDGHFGLFHFGPFFSLPIPPPPNHQNQNFEKWKNTWRYHVTQMHQKSWSYATFFKIRCVTDVIFIFHFGLFFVLPLRHPTIQKIKI